VRALRENAFWRNVCADPQLQPEIRNNLVTIYYCGLALVRELRLRQGVLKASVHHKFVPLQRTGSSRYHSLSWNEQAGLRFDDDLKPQQIAVGNAGVLKAYKRLMKYETGPEGILQQAIVTSITNRVLDQQVEFPAGGHNKIDVCHFDLSIQKIVFAEIKRIDDSRLFGPGEVPEVVAQLRDYGVWIARERETICSAYTDVIRWKRDLGLARRLRGIPDEPLDVERKPLLVIGDCSSADVRRIKNARNARDGSPWSRLWKHLESVVCGVILCGTSGCDLAVRERSQQKLWFGS